jgi:hypothetical protein
MATKLNPGADQVLVAAAYRAAMANVPVDQTKAYEQASKGYAKFASGMVAMYTPIVKGVIKAAEPLIEKVKERVGDNLEELWLNINKPFEDDYINDEFVLDERGEQITNLVEEWERYTGEGLLLESFNLGNFDSADIEEFQTEIKKLYPNAFPKWGTDGKMGLETETAIKNLLKDKEEYSKTNTIIEAGGKYSYTDNNGQTSNISLIGQDEYIQQLKDENANTEAKFANNEITKKERDDLINANLAKAQSAKNSAKAFSKEQVRVMNLINSGNFNQMASGAMSMDFINAAMERGRTAADGSRVVRGYDDDGNIALMWIDKYGRAKINPNTGKSWVVSQGQMKKFIVENDTESELAVTTNVTTDQQTLGKSGIKFNEQEVMNNITKMISSGGEKTFLHMINTSIADNNGTFVEHVYGVKKDGDGNWTFDPTKLSQEIYTQLDMLGGKFDSNKDGDVDAQDFVTNENKAALANYLTSYNPTSVNAFASFMRDTAERYHDQGARTLSSGSSGDGDPTDETNTPISSWVDFKQSFTAHDFSTDEKFILPTGNFKGEVIDAYLTINEDGTYNLEMGEDDNRNQNNLKIKDLATRLQKDLYPNTTIEAIENMFKAQSESQEGFTSETIQSKEQSFADKINKLEAPYLQRISKGADINYIVDNLWQPNTPSGYNMGENGKALFDYLVSQGFGKKQDSLYDGGGTTWGGKAFMEIPKPGTKGMTLQYGGEHVWVYQRNIVSGKSSLVGKWTGDSTGGRGYDLEDIQEILTALGIPY